MSLFTFLYTRNEQVEFEIQNMLPFTLVLLKKEIVINITESVKILKEENNKTLMNKVKWELSMWRDIVCS